MYRNRPLATALAITLGILSFPAFAQDTDFTGGVDNNWFEANNWTPAGVPTATSSAILNGGFSVTALAADAGGASVEAETLFVGVESGGGVQNSLLSEVDLLLGDDSDVGTTSRTPGLSTGQVDLVNASIIFPNGSEQLDVGTAVDFDNVGTSAAGVLNIIEGSILNVEDVLVGRNSIDGGVATGVVTVLNGSILGTDEGNVSDFRVGTSRTASNASGLVSLENGAIRGFGFNRIGTTENSGGVGNGTLRLTNAVAAFDPTTLFLAARFNVTTSSPDAIALFDLETSYLAAGDASIGDGATINLSVDGLTRATDGTVGAGTYSAIDFTSATIDDVTLNIDFTFDAADGGSFDLVSLSQGNAFSGTLFDEINVTGLGSRGWQTEVVAGTASAGEIFRLTVDVLPPTSPPPGSASLQPVPTLSNAFLALMAALLGLVGFVALRHQP